LMASDVLRHHVLMSLQKTEFFLVLENPRQRMAHWAAVLVPLEVSPDIVRFESVAAYFHRTTDRALLRLRYSAGLSSSELRLVQDVVDLAEVRLVQPGVWPQAERTRFFRDQIASCEVAITTCHTIGDSLAELVRELRNRKAPRARGSVPMMSSTIVEPRAQGNSVEPPLRSTERKTIGPTPRNNHRNIVDPAFRTERYQGRLSESRTSIPIASDDAPTGKQPRQPEPDDSVVLDQVEDEVSKAIFDPALPSMRRLERNPVRATALHVAPSQNATIGVRFLRGGKWLPARIGALSLRSAVILTGAAPRVEDSVHVGLTYRDTSALVRGRVTRLCDESSVSGATGFVVDFELDAPAHQQMVTLLTSARRANVTILPPPPRTSRRLPVEWPVSILTRDGDIQSHALDISAAGMFVRTRQNFALDSIVQFSMVLDDGGSVVYGTARVVRRVTDDDATQRAFVAGYGLHLLALDGSASQRWEKFLVRVYHRCQRRILVGAHPARLAELSALLSGAGYAVTGGSDAAAFVQLAESERRPMDAAVIDPAWAGQGASSAWLEALLEARSVPCVSPGPDGTRARDAVDQLLLVFS
jgi:hypothetical protein